jgi:hypothetical protein
MMSGYGDALRPQFAESPIGIGTNWISTLATLPDWLTSSLRISHLDGGTSPACGMTWESTKGLFRGVSIRTQMHTLISGLTTQASAL